jgi:hypothetical protein
LSVGRASIPNCSVASSRDRQHGVRRKREDAARAYAARVSGHRAEMTIKADEISKIIREQIRQLRVAVDVAKSAPWCRSVTASRASMAASAPWRARCSSSRTACSASR